jgi:hypothetical protein
MSAAATLRCDHHQPGLVSEPRDDVNTPLLSSTPPLIRRDGSLTDAVVDVPLMRDAPNRDDPDDHDRVHVHLHEPVHEWDPVTVSVALLAALLTVLCCVIVWVLCRRMVTIGNYFLLFVWVAIAALPPLLMLIHFIKHRHPRHGWTPWQRSTGLMLSLIPLTAVCIFFLYRAEHWYDPLPITMRSTWRNSTHYTLTLSIDKQLSWPCACPQAIEWPAHTTIPELLPAHGEPDECLQLSKVLPGNYPGVVTDHARVLCGDGRFTMRTPSFLIQAEAYQQTITGEPFAVTSWSGLQFLYQHWWSLYVWLPLIVLAVMALCMTGLAVSPRHRERLLHRHSAHSHSHAVQATSSRSVLPDL